MFDTVRVWNEYQDTGDVDLSFINDVPSNMKKKFRIWRMDIPRDIKDGRQRLRNTWSKVKFTMNTLPDVPLEDLCNRLSSEFMVRNTDGTWSGLDFRGYHTQFVYDSENQRIVEKTLSGDETEIAYYYMRDNMIIKTGTNNHSIE